MYYVQAIFDDDHENSGNELAKIIERDWPTVLVVADRYDERTVDFSYVGKHRQAV